MLALAAAAAAATVALAAQSPRTVRASILNAANAQQSVHYVTTQAIGNALITLKGDVEAADGIQHITLKVGKRTGHLTILALDQTAYMQGDALGLEAQGLTKAQATKYSGQWISVPKGDKLYGPTVDDVTLGSAIKNITPRGKLTAATRKVHGTRIVAVRGISGTGKKKVIRVLAAKAKGKRLPLEEDEINLGQQYLSHTLLSKWNESVTVQAPASSTPIATVRQT